MDRLLGVVFFSLFLSFFAKKRVIEDNNKTRVIDWFTLVMLVPLILMCGLRTAYNDTATYITGFNNAPTVSEFLGNPDNLNIWGNPLFYSGQSFFKQYISDNYHVFFMVIAIFTVSSFVYFIKKYSENFTFSMLMFFAIGLYLMNFAAVKQCLAMAVLTFAVPQLLKGRYVRFYLLLCIAVLFHSYAILFVILPVFLAKPWSKITYLTIIIVLGVLFTFQSTITSILDYAEKLGKSISEEEVFNTASINVLRLAVYAVPPAVSFVFKKYLEPYMNRTIYLLSNMSIFSFLIMLLGTVSAGNLFARCAIYFEIGTICIFPWMIKRIFESRSQKIVLIVAGVFYFLFFMYDNTGFANSYRAISFIQFLLAIF